ncbi:hypothetical protein HDU96_010294 [Phlyctochytrium bullatum]|nr:hypothetical protein HDU96_010294 [Phlyctochytrium bullatum]
MKSDSEAPPDASDLNPPPFKLLSQSKSLSAPNVFSTINAGAGARGRLPNRFSSLSKKRLDRPTWIVIAISLLLFILWILFIHPLEHDGGNPFSVSSLADGAAAQAQGDHSSATGAFEDSFSHSHPHRNSGTGERARGGVADLTGSDSPEDQCDHSGWVTFRNRRSGLLFGKKARRGNKRLGCPMELRESMVNVSMLYNPRFVELRNVVAKQTNECKGFLAEDSGRNHTDKSTLASECAAEVLAVASSCSPALARFAHSAKEAGMKFRLIWSYHWGGSGHRIRIAHSYLRNLPAHKLVILALTADDAEFAVVPSCTAASLSRRYRSISAASDGAPVIAAGEKFPWPDVELMGDFDAAAKVAMKKAWATSSASYAGYEAPVSAFKHANGGLLVGEAWALRDVLASVYKSDCDENSAHPTGPKPSRSHIVKSQGRANADVSRFISRAFLSGLAFHAQRAGDPGEVVMRDRFGASSDLAVIGAPSLGTAESMPRASPNGERASQQREELRKGPKQPEKDELAEAAAPPEVKVALGPKQGSEDAMVHEGPSPIKDLEPKVALGPKEPAKVELSRREYNTDLDIAPLPPAVKPAVGAVSFRPYIALDYWNDLMQTLTGVSIEDMEIGVDETGRGGGPVWIRNRNTNGEPCLVYHRGVRAADGRTLDRVVGILERFRATHGVGEAVAKASTKEEIGLDAPPVKNSEKGAVSVGGGKNAKLPSQFRRILRRLAIVICLAGLALSFALLVHMPKRVLELWRGWKSSSARIA